MPCRECGATIQSLRKLGFCDSCYLDPSVPSYQTVRVTEAQLEGFMLWKEIWMSWWWVEGRLKKKFRSAGNPRGWMPIYCSRDEAGAKTTIRFIEAIRNSDKPLDKAQTSELNSLKRFKEFRVAPPKEEKSSKRKKAQAAEAPVEIRKEAPDTTLRPECPGCGARGARKVLSDGKPRWKCPKCGRKWKRTAEAAREAPVKPSKALRDDSATSTARKPKKKPRKT